MAARKALDILGRWWTIIATVAAVFLAVMQIGGLPSCGDYQTKALAADLKKDVEDLEAENRTEHKEMMKQLQKLAEIVGRLDERTKGIKK